MRFPINSSCSKLLNWAYKIRDSSLNARWDDVFSHFHQINKTGIQLTDPAIFHPILKACVFLSFRHGNSIHASIIKQGFESFTSLGNSITDFYVKSGFLDSAQAVFTSMNSKDSISWNIMIHGYLEQGLFDEGLWLFMQARVIGFEPNVSTLVLVVQACRNLRAVHDGLKLHGYIIQSGFWSISSVQNSLLSLYADSGIELARKLFDEMCERDVISWSVMIGGYAQREEAYVALVLFREMVSKIGFEIDAQVMVSAVKACTSLEDLSGGKLVHGFVICRGLDCDSFVGNSLVDMYSKCSDTDSAFKVFSNMPMKNLVSWNSLLSGFVHNEKHSDALLLLDSMRNLGIEADEVTLVNLLHLCKYYIDPLQCKLIHSIVLRRGYESNDLVINSLTDAYAKCDLITLAWTLFIQMKRRDTVNWSTMIAGFTHCGMPGEAISLFQEMYRAQEKPNAITVLNLLKACSCYAELKRAKWSHGIAIRRDLASEVVTGTAILDMYSSCGDIEASRKAFNQISCKNIVSYSAMISACGMNGLAHDAIALLAEMKLHGLKPNSVTTLSVLSACSHGGLVAEGLRFFEDLVQDPEVELRLEHHSCVVDMLGRAGKIDSAMELIKSLPEGLKAGPSGWGAVLSACRNYGNSKLGAGEVAVARVLELEPSNSGGYMLGSGMYAASGSWVDAARMRRLVKEREVRVVAGYSLVHVNNKACRFVAGGKNHQNHPLWDEICFVVEQLHEWMMVDSRKNEILSQE